MQSTSKAELSLQDNGVVFIIAVGGVVIGGGAGFQFGVVGADFALLGANESVQDGLLVRFFLCFCVGAERGDVGAEGGELGGGGFGGGHEGEGALADGVAFAGGVGEEALGFGEVEVAVVDL